MKPWNSLTHYEKTRFASDHGSLVDEKHSIQIYTWFRSIIERHAAEMSESTVGSISDKTGMQWEIDFATYDNTFQTEGGSYNQYSHEILTAGSYTITGVLKIYSANEDTDIPTHEFEFKHIHEL